MKIFNLKQYIMKLLALIKCLFGKSPKKIVKKNLKMISEFKLDLLKVIAMEVNQVRAIVFLFRATSTIQDQGGFNNLIKSLRKKNYGQLSELIESLENLQAHIDRAGRDKYGMNRTSFGEEVTPENVFLGDVYGLFTKPASFWLERQEVMKKESRPDLEQNERKKITNWDCINSQAGNFIKSHTIPMIEEIEKIEAYIA